MVTKEEVVAFIDESEADIFDVDKFYKQNKHNPNWRLNVLKRTRNANLSATCPICGKPSTEKLGAAYICRNCIDPWWDIELDHYTPCVQGSLFLPEYSDDPVYSPSMDYMEHRAKPKDGKAINEAFMI